MNWRRLLPLLDLLIEVADARLPCGSRNPRLLAAAAGKARLLILNKADLADPALTVAWCRFLERCEGVPVLPLAALSGKGLRALERRLAVLAAAKERRRPLRAVVVGIPNVGKSTVINHLVGRKAAATGAVPGITRGLQWVRLRPGLELLDTPGHLPTARSIPAWQLTAVGAVRADAEASLEAAEALLAALTPRHGRSIGACYGLEAPFSLSDIARKRGLLSRGGTPDLLRAATLVLRDFSRGKWGRITLEEPPVLPDQ